MERRNKRHIGSEFEKRAADYLEEKGYQILEYNYQNRYGEIDIIAKDKEGYLVYFEVKYRKNNRYGEPLEAVDFRKQKKICKTAMWHFMKKGYESGMSCRFDVIGMDGEGDIWHVENAFEYQEIF